MPASQKAEYIGKIGLLLANLGTPDGTDYWSVRRYLSQFLSDPKVVDMSPWVWQPLLQLVILTRRPFTSGAAYRKIWNNEANESPLLTITRDQSRAIQEKLGPEIQVEFCMRYGNPSTKDVLGKMIADGCEKILFFPLYPQFAGATWDTAQVEFHRQLGKIDADPDTRVVPPYYEQEAFIQALAGSVQHAYDRMDTRPDVLVCSYHGLPKRHITNGDPYQEQCQETTALLRKALEFSAAQIVSAFQSRFGPDEWITPYTVEEVARLAKAGKRNIAVIAPAFSADCIETLEEINDEIREAFVEAGGETFTYIPCLNAEPAHIEALCSIIRNEIADW